MQRHNKAEQIGRGHRPAASLLTVTLTGAAFLVGSFLAPRLFPSDPLAAELAAAAGAVILLLPILRSAFLDLVRGEMHMNELVALAVLAAMAQGDYQTAGIVSFIMLISLVIETRTAAGAHAALEGLIRLTPSTARRLPASGTVPNETSFEEVPVGQLTPGDRIRLLPGDYVPADGIIETGRTTLNESTITGESLPQDKGPGDEVFAGTQNLTGRLDVRVTKVGPDTTLGRIRELILAAEQTRLPFMRIIDRYLGYYTPAVLMIAGLIWFFTGEAARVIALLVVACPCALILATPSAIVAALSAAARRGVLIRHVADLESASRLDAFVLDKTGTLTTGRLGVARLAPRENGSPSVLLQTAAIAEQFSSHPAARAMVNLARETGLALPAPEDFHEEHGMGVRARWEGQVILAGRREWLRANGIPDADDTAEPEYSVIHVARDGHYLGWIGLQDEIRPDAAESVAALRRLRIERIAMVTGDRASVAHRVAEQIGCPETRPACLPQEKVAFVTGMRSEGYRVAFVGDGVNDAPALAASDIGIAMGAAGSDVALHSATIALMRNDLRLLPFVLCLSRATRKIIHQNLGAGLLFIGGGVVLSSMGWLNPIVAALLHHAGALGVILNSARLVRTVEPAQTTGEAHATP